MDCRLEVIVHNVDDDCLKYIVARICEGKLWFWGSWDSLEEADITAKEIDGVVLIKKGQEK